jgi:hypothetical protein
MPAPRIHPALDTEPNGPSPPLTPGPAKDPAGVPVHYTAVAALDKMDYPNTLIGLGGGKPQPFPMARRRGRFESLGNRTRA